MTQIWLEPTKFAAEVIADGERHAYEGLTDLIINATPIFSAASFEIRLIRSRREEIQSQIDGEEWLPGHRFRVEVIPNCLPVIAPEAWVPPWKVG